MLREVIRDAIRATHGDENAVPGLVAERLTGLTREQWSLVFAEVETFDLPASPVNDEVRKTAIAMTGGDESQLVPLLRERVDPRENPDLFQTLRREMLAHIGRVAQRMLIEELSKYRSAR
jgi:hypothetical protein